MSYFIPAEDRVRFSDERYTKIDVAAGEYLFVGLNCFQPGQVQDLHDHPGRDKCYIVLDGQGAFTVGDETREVGRGWVIFAPAGVPHGIVNGRKERLIVLTAIAPAP
ncbi:MAG: cupin domain-containing protein [Gemmatimonadota bacterium]